MKSMDLPATVPNKTSADVDVVGNVGNPVQNDSFTDLQDEVMVNFQKPNVPNVNVPEKIIICMDVCYDNPNSLYHISDGTTFTPINMMKRVLDFFLHSKHAINKGSEFAVVILNDSEPSWVQNFTNNIRDVINTIDYVMPEQSQSETFDLAKLFQLIKDKVNFPEYIEVKEGTCMPPPYVVRMIMLYGRSNCIPVVPQDDPYFKFLKQHLYFYIDILLAHEEDCAQYRCVEIYDALQDLDNGYSYVFEVLRNATKIHDCMAKLLAHPLQRPLQKNTNYTFGSSL